MKRVYIDVTDLIEYVRSNATLSGIQRVSVMTIQRIRAARGGEGCFLIAYHPIKKRIVVYSSEQFVDFTYDQQQLIVAFQATAHSHGGIFGERNLDDYLDAKYKWAWKAQVQRVRLTIANRLSKGRTFRQRGIVETTTVGRRRGPLTMLPLNDFGPARGDIIFVPGATWNFDAYLDYLAKSSRRGVEVVQFVHDLIPLVTPEHVADHVPEQFSLWLTQLSSIASRFMVNSRATHDDLARFLSANGHAPKRIDVVPLAHEFIPEAPKPQLAVEPARFLNPRYNSPARISAIVYSVARLPYVLCVGTLESRKNVWTLARVWRSLAEELGERTPRLVFAGKHGWLKEDFDDFMRATGGVGGLIRIAERPSDAELGYLYANCQFSAFMSYYEGWGLPIGEGLWFGRPVVASSSSSMPEVGGDLVDYADPNDFRAIRAALRRLIVDDEYREARAVQIRAAKLRTWRDTVDDLWEALSTESLPARDLQPDAKAKAGAPVAT